MKFTIVGAGSLGTIIGANLLNAGHEVTMVARGARARWLRENGLKVRGLIDLDLPCTVVEDTNELRGTDVLILAVKTYQMEGALAGIGHLKVKAVFSVANGVMKNEQLAEVYGADRVMGCMADTSGELHEDGVAEFTRNVCMNIGPVVADTRTDAAEIARVIDAAGVVTVAVDNIATIEWSKFVCWLAMFGLAVISRRTTGECLSVPELARSAVLQLKEAGAVAARLGVELSDSAPFPAATVMAASVAEGTEKVVAVGENFARNAPTHRMSSLQDLEAGRKLEVHGTLGYLVDKAAEVGVAVPTIAACYDICAGIDAMQ